MDSNLSFTLSRTIENTISYRFSVIFSQIQSQYFLRAHQWPWQASMWHPQSSLASTLNYFRHYLTSKESHHRSCSTPRSDNFAGAWALEGDQLSSAPPRRGREVVRLLALGPPSPVQLVPAATHAQNTNCSLPGTTAWQRRPVEALWMKASSWVLQLADTFLRFT